MIPISQQTTRPPRTQARRTYGRRVASLRYLPNGVMLQLEAPYDRSFTDTMKKSITSKKRLWDGGDKCWYVCKDQFDKLCHLLDQYFDETILLDFPAHEVSASSYAMLYLLDGAPLEVVRSAYKALAQLHHPDRGGDVAVMQSINQAYKDILGELKNGD
jgi:hypothetical protein